MSALFEQGFFVRVPAWHGEGIVLADYPGREEAMHLAGHDWDVVELDELRMGIPTAVLAAAGRGYAKEVHRSSPRGRQEKRSCRRVVRIHPRHLHGVVKPPKRVYCCARCGRQFKTGEDRLHSEWSGNSYCFDIGSCAKRARRFTGRVPIVWRAPNY